MPQKSVLLELSLPLCCLPRSAREGAVGVVKTTNRAKVEPALSLRMSIWPIRISPAALPFRVASLASFSAPSAPAHQCRVPCPIILATPFPQFLTLLGERCGASHILYVQPIAT